MTDHADQDHLNAWARGEASYVILTGKVVLGCTRCEYNAIGDTRERVIAAYQEYHVQLMRERAQRALVRLEDRLHDEGPTREGS